MLIKTHRTHRGVLQTHRPFKRPPLFKPSPPLRKGHLKFTPLGGCGEVTRSMYVYEYDDDIVIVDMGLQFPEEDMPGIDYLIPNVEYLKPKKKKHPGDSNHSRPP